MGTTNIRQLWKVLQLQNPVKPKSYWLGQVHIYYEKAICLNKVGQIFPELQYKTEEEPIIPYLLQSAVLF